MFWIVLIVLISYKCGTYIQGFLVKSNFRGGQMETVKKKRKRKKKKKKPCKFNTLLFSFLYSKIYLGTSNRIFNSLVNRLSIINSLCNLRGIETFYDHSVCFFNFSSAHKDQQSKMHIIA